MIISICNLKGGCSKSMTAVHLATFLTNLDFSVALIDCDRQTSSLKWIKNLDLDIELFNSNDPDDIEDALMDMQHEYDFLIVDTGSNAEAIMDLVLRNSNHCLIPSQPSEMDVDATELTIKRVIRARRNNKDLTATLFLTRVFKNTISLRTTSDRFTGYEGIKFNNAQIPNTQRLVKLINTNQTAFNASGCSDLAETYTTLFNTLLEA